MRYLRFTLLQSYILSIQKNKRKALLIINTGIFFSIFAFSSATISFFIEKKISDIQNELTITQISAREGNNTISFFENEINTLSKFLNKESGNTAKKRFIDEFKTLNKINTTRDYYGSFIYFNLFALEEEIKQMKKLYGVDMYDKNDPFYTDEIIPAMKKSWDKETVDEFIDSLESTDEYINKLLNINIENYLLQKPLTLEEIINETKNEDLNSLNQKSQVLNDYTLVYDSFEQLTIFFTHLMNYLKGIKGNDDNLIKEYETKILYYSNLERNIILTTFVFQFAIFVIIQIFEINSVNFNLKKKKNEKKVY